MPVEHICTIVIVRTQGSQSSRLTYVTMDTDDHWLPWIYHMVMVQSAVFSWTLTVLDLAMSSYKHSAQWVWPFDFKFNYVFPRRFPTTVAFHNAMQHCYLLANVKCAWFCAWVLERLLKIIVIKNLAWGWTVKYLNMKFDCQYCWCWFYEFQWSNLTQIKALLHQARHAGRHDPRHHATNSGAHTPYYTTVVATIAVCAVQRMYCFSGRHRHISLLLWPCPLRVMQPKWLTDPFGRMRQSHHLQV